VYALGERNIKEFMVVSGRNIKEGMCIWGKGHQRGHVCAHLGERSVSSSQSRFDCILHFDYSCIDCII